MSDKKNKVYEFLKTHNIKYEIVDHSPIYTIEEMESLNLDKEKDIPKNIFIRDDKKRQYFLIVVEKDKRIDLKQLRTTLDSRPLTFASENDLNKYLGLDKGAVSPLGIINNDERNVIVLIDEELKNHSSIGVHPNENDATIFLSIDSLIYCIEQQGNEYNFICL